MFYFLTYPFFFTAFRLIARVLGRLRSSGEENVPRAGGFIYCPNHLSDADPPALFATLPRRAWFIGKQELFDIPIFGWMIHHFRAFPIKRDSADRAALRRAEQCLRRGEPILIFPEGRCAQDGRLQRIQPGAALLAMRAGVPIVPIGVQHTNQLLPYGTLVPRPSRQPIIIAFGPPIFPRDFASLGRGEAIAAMTEKIGTELARLTHQPAPPTAAATKRVAREATDETGEAAAAAPVAS